MILIVPVELIVLIVLLIKKKICVEELFLPIGTEVVCGIIFLMYVFCNVSIGEFFENVGYILSDGAHQDSFGSRLTTIGNEMLLYIVPMAILIATFEVLYFFLKKYKKVAWIRKEINAFVIAAFLYSGVLVAKMSYRGWIHLDLTFPIIMLSEAFLYLLIRFYKYYSNQGLLLMVAVCGGAAICCCFASNLQIWANAQLLLPALILMWVVFLQADWEFAFTTDAKSLLEQEQDDGKLIMSRIPIYAFALVIVLARVTLIRFTSVQPCNIFDDYYKIAVGTEKNIRVTENEHIRYHSKYATIAENVTAEDSLLIFGSDMYFYFFTGSDIAIPSTISTPVFDENLLAYYKKYPYKIPSVIIVDKYYQGMDKFLSVPEFSEWAIENYDLENAQEYDYDIVIRRK